MSILPKDLVLTLLLLLLGLDQSYLLVQLLLKDTAIFLPLHATALMEDAECVVLLPPANQLQRSRARKSRSTKEKLWISLIIGPIIRLSFFSSHLHLDV